MLVMMVKLLIWFWLRVCEDIFIIVVWLFCLRIWDSIWLVCMIFGVVWVVGCKVFGMLYFSVFSKLYGVLVFFSSVVMYWLIEVLLLVLVILIRCKCWDGCLKKWLVILLSLVCRFIIGISKVFLNFEYLFGFDVFSSIIVVLVLIVCLM